MEHGAGKSATYSYNDPLGRQTRISYGGISHNDDIITYSNDWLITSTKTTEYDHEIIRYMDAAGRVDREEQVFDASTANRTVFPLEYSYFLTGRRKSLTLPSGRVYDYIRDVSGRLSSFKDETDATDIFSVNRDSAGRDEGHDFGNGTDVDFVLRNNGLPAEINHTFGDSTTLNFSMQYNASGLVVDKDNSRHANLGESYHYDAVDRLDEYHRDGTQPGLIKDQTFNLDDLGNWASTTFDSSTESRAHNSLNQITGRSGTLIEGGTSPLAVTFDDAGNLADDGYRTMSYDANNRLVSVTVAVGAPVGTPGTYNYKYDAQGRRISDGDRIFIYDGWRVVEERLIDSSSSEINYPIEKLYTWGPRYLDELVAIDQSVTMVYDPSTSGWVPPDSGNSSFLWDDLSSTGLFIQRYYAHRDNIYNICAVTNSDGDVIKEYAYNFSGKRETIYTANRPDAEAFNIAYGSTGQRHDSATGLMYWKNRYYSIEQNRFINRDPLGYIDGNNQYSLYKWLDPIGFSSTTCTSVADNGNYYLTYGERDFTPGNSTLNPDQLDQTTRDLISNIQTLARIQAVAGAGGTAATAGSAGQAAGQISSEGAADAGGEVQGTGDIDSALDRVEAAAIKVHGIMVWVRVKYKVCKYTGCSDTSKWIDYDTGWKKIENDNGDEYATSSGGYNPRNMEDIEHAAVKGMRKVVHNFVSDNGLHPHYW